MDRMLKTICGLLESPDPMRRRAAAIVLAELAPREQAVVAALGAALPQADAMLAACLLGALEASGLPSAAPWVVPLLDSDSLELKMRAAAVVAKGGTAVVPVMRERLASAAPLQKALLADVLARMPSREAFKVLLDLLFDPDPEVARQVCEAVARHVGEAPAPVRSALHRETVAFMNAPRSRGQERVLAACLLLLGSIGQPEARTILLAHGAKSFSLAVRRQALIGLKGLTLTGAAAAEVMRRVLPNLEDTDEGIVRHTLDILGRLPPAITAKAPWRKLLQSTISMVRVAAARRVAAADTATVNRELLALLKHRDPEVQEVAAGALAAHEGATRMLLEALAGAEDPAAAWRLARILKPHAEAVDAKARQQFLALAAGDLERGHHRGEAILYFLRNVDPAVADGVLREAGLKHKAARRWEAGVECLRRLAGTERFDGAARYALGVCNLKLSPRQLTPQARLEDPALRGFQTLAREKAFKLAARLKKEKVLDAKDVFYVGFHLSALSGEERAVGLELLDHVAVSWPKTEEGKAARHKLKLARA
jgi:HEAT repeat protein